MIWVPARGVPGFGVYLGFARPWPFSKDERCLEIHRGLDPVVFGPFHIVLPKKVEPKAVFFRVNDGQELGPKSNPKGLWNLALENAELDPLTEALAYLGYLL
jgi:hypothetical protein